MSFLTGWIKLKHSYRCIKMYSQLLVPHRDDDLLLGSPGECTRYYYNTWFMFQSLWNGNGVHLSAVLKNTALVQGIRCEPSGEHLVPWTCAVFSHTARKWAPFVFSHTTDQNFQRRKEVYSRPTWQNTILVVNRRRSVNNIYVLYSMYTIQHVYM